MKIQDALDKSGFTVVRASAPAKAINAGMATFGTMDPRTSAPAVIVAAIYKAMIEAQKDGAE